MVFGRLARTRRTVTSRCSVRPIGARTAGQEDRLEVAAAQASGAQRRRMKVMEIVTIHEAGNPAT